MHAGEPVRVGDTVRRTRTVSGRELAEEIVASRLLNALVAEELPDLGSEFLHVDWSLHAPVRPGDEITAEARVVATREGKPISRVAATVTNQNGEVVLEGTALVYRAAA
jgi:acyl dehydratase